MKHMSKIALAVALIGGVSATALTIDTASAWGWKDRGERGQMGDDRYGRNGRYDRDDMGRRGKFSHGMRGPRGGMDRMGPMGPMTMLKDMDVNKDGTLTKDELTTGLDKKITDNDTNGDEAVDLEEFKAEWQKMTQQAMVRAFQRLDRDGNGKVTAEEVKDPALMMFERPWTATTTTSWTGPTVLPVVLAKAVPASCHNPLHSRIKNPQRNPDLVHFRFSQPVTCVNEGHEACRALSEPQEMCVKR